MTLLATLRTPTFLALIGALLIPTLGCTDPGPEAETADRETTAAASSEAATEKVFDEALEDEECTFLEIDQVASSVGVAASELEQMDVSGCLYSWDDGSIHLDATVYDTVERARQWFARFTEEESPEQIAEAKEQMSERLDEMRAEGEIDEQAAATAGALTDAMPDDPITEQAVDGIGNEASLDSTGALRVRYGNLMFQVVARTGEANEDDPDLAVEIARLVAKRLDNL